GGIPQVDCSVSATTCQDAVVGREGDALETAPQTPVTRLGAAASGIPNFNRAIEIRGSYAPPIAAERHALNPEVRLKAEPDPRGGEVPELDRMVPSSRDQRLAVGREGQPLDLRPGREGSPLPARRDLPNLHVLVFGPGDQPPAVGREEDTIHPA